MADAEEANPQSDEDPRSSETPPEAPPPAEVGIELWDSLPGGRAVAVVEQEGRLILLASKGHVSQQARDEFADLLGKLTREGTLALNWPDGK